MRLCCLRGDAPLHTGHPMKGRGSEGQGKPNPFLFSEDSRLRPASGRRGLRWYLAALSTEPCQKVHLPRHRGTGARSEACRAVGRAGQAGRAPVEPPVYRRVAASEPRRQRGPHRPHPEHPAPDDRVGRRIGGQGARARPRHRARRAGGACREPGGRPLLGPVGQRGQQDCHDTHRPRHRRGDTRSPRPAALRPLDRCVVDALPGHDQHRVLADVRDRGRSRRQALLGTRVGADLGRPGGRAHPWPRGGR